MRTFISIAALALAITTAVPSAAQTRTATLALTTADYVNPSHFESRLDRAARRVCAVAGRSTLRDRAAEQVCIAAAREEGMAQFGVMLARYEAGVVVLASR